jgi:hypothetical protein
MSIDAEADSDTGLDAVYQANSQQDIVKFSPGEKALLLKALLEIVPEFRSRIRIFSPLCSLYSLYRQQLGGNRPEDYGCRGGIDFFFVNASDGNTYPCGFRGNENLGKFWDMQSQASQNDRSCTRCEWECFRDPSELFGPLLDIFSGPRRSVNRWYHDRLFFRFWASDALYYWACDYFNGRRPPRYKKLATFHRNPFGQPGPAAIHRFGLIPKKLMRQYSDFSLNKATTR